MSFFMMKHISVNGFMSALMLRAEFFFIKMKQAKLFL